MEVTFASSAGQRAKQVGFRPCFYTLVELTNELQMASISSEEVSSYAQAEEGVSTFTMLQCQLQCHADDQASRRKPLREADKVREDGEESPVTELEDPNERLSHSSEPVGPPAYRVYVGV